jgi:hypothetical protein
MAKLAVGQSIRQSRKFPGPVEARSDSSDKKARTYNRGTCILHAFKMDLNHSDERIIRYSGAEYPAASYLLKVA